jgi:hypothetical protein
MKTDHHATMRDLIDKSLVGDATPQEEQSLRAHLPACAECQAYLSASTRVIAGLGGFSFDVDPDLQAGLEAKVLWSLKLGAQQLEAMRPSRRRMVWGCTAALVLLVTGSLIAFEFGNLAAGFLHLQPTQIQRILLALWVVPSLCFSLLFPVLPRLLDREERFL